MGREIVYCWKCSTRLKGEDFETGDAYRVGDKVSCAGESFEAHPLIRRRQAQVGEVGLLARPGARLGDMQAQWALAHVLLQ